MNNNSNSIIFKCYSEDKYPSSIISNLFNIIVSASKDDNGNNLNQDELDYIMNMLIDAEEKNISYGPYNNFSDEDIDIFKKTIGDERWSKVEDLFTKKKIRGILWHSGEYKLMSLEKKNMLIEHILSKHPDILEEKIFKDIVINYYNIESEVSDECDTYYKTNSSLHIIQLLINHGIKIDKDDCTLIYCNKLFPEDYESLTVCHYRSVSNNYGTHSLISLC